MKLQHIILLLAILSIHSLSPSEAGVNDWHINSIGEVRSLSFFKNKIIFKSKLNMFGHLDKSTGEIEHRITLSDNERAIQQPDHEFTVNTRHQQFITYRSKNGVIENVVDNKLLSLGDKIIDKCGLTGEELYLSQQKLYKGQQVVQTAQQNQNFMGIVSKDDNDVILIYSNELHKKVCIKICDSNFGKCQNKLCLETLQNQLLEEIHYIHHHLILSLNGLTFVLNHEMVLEKTINQELVDVVGKILVFDGYFYDVQKKDEVESRPLKSSREGSEVFLKRSQDKQEIQVFKDGVLLAQINIGQNKPAILRGWINFRTEIDSELILQFQDLELVLYQIYNQKSKIIWKRQESLSQIDKVLFMKYKKDDGLDNPYHRNLISFHNRNQTLAQKLVGAPKEFMMRVVEEVNDLRRMLFDFTHHALDYIGRFQAGSMKKFIMPRQQEIKYGLKKYILAVTKSSTIIAVDTKTKQVLWKTLIPQTPLLKHVSLIKLQRDYETQAALLISYNLNEKTLTITEIRQDGTLELLKTYHNIQAEPTIHKLNQHALAIRDMDRILQFVLVEQEGDPKKEFLFYSVSGNEVVGYKAHGERVVPIWNFFTSDNETIIATASAFRGDQKAHIPLFDSEKVFFKNIDFTNLAILSSQNHTHLSLHIINGQTGKVMFNQYRNSINRGLFINLVYDENNVLVSYYNAKNKMYQIWTIQQYHERIQNSAWNMIMDFWYGVELKPQQNRQNTIFASQLYGCSISIKHLFVSESKMSLNRRNLFIITREGKIYTINRDSVSTRRPRKDGRSFFSNQKYMQYTYLLPYLPSNYLSYDKTLHGLKQMVFQSTEMESTIFILSYGVDLFLIRTAPDKTFDMITQDFNHNVLLLILIVATILICFIRSKVNFAKLIKPHLD